MKNLTSFFTYILLVSCSRLFRLVASWKHCFFIYSSLAYISLIIVTAFDALFIVKFDGTSYRLITSLLRQLLHTHRHLHLSKSFIFSNKNFLLTIVQAKQPRIFAIIHLQNRN